ncbi:hypothetical protein GA0115253_102472 [Streptomyces sp. Termitarium-T10T-6]|nr:hypothetical protein [Streptomyces sp. Termitarium-T10T-6]SCD96090.1 hypothetical protein GA0115253_102472 [Streptomyces sp. Termitarium-T10T-6]
MPPAQHSLTVRLPSDTTDAALAAALTAAAGLWWPGDDPPSPPVDGVPCPAPAVSDTAAGRRAARGPAARSRPATGCARCCCGTRTSGGKR